MLFFLSKILSFLISPFNLAIIFALGALFFPKLRKRLIFMALFILLVFSNPLLFRITIGIWEEIPRALPTNNKEFRSVVMLGGVSAQHESSGRIRFSASNDRLMQALILTKQNDIERLVISGGNASIIYKKRPEGAYLKEILVKMGWADDLILVDSLSRNTYENAYYTHKLFQENGLPPEIMLVTSAWHMPRAYRCFTKQGFKVLPVTSDYLKPIGKITPGDIFIPSSGTLSAWDVLFKEWTGLFYYYVRGYI